MTYLEELAQARGVNTKELLVLLRRAFGEITERFQRIDGRLDPIENRLLLVDVLPADAPFGALIRLKTGTVGERATLYLGNGPGNPLTRIVPQQLP